MFEIINERVNNGTPILGTIVSALFEKSLEFGNFEVLILLREKL